MILPAIFVVHVPSLLVCGGLYILLTWSGLPVAAAAAYALGAALFFLAGNGLHIRQQRSPWMPTTASQGAAVLCWCTAVGMAVAGVAHGPLRIAAGAAGLAGALAGVAMTPVYARRTRASFGERVRRPIQAATLEEVDDVIHAYRSRLATGRSLHEQAEVELSLAAHLIMSSGLTGHRDALVEAEGILDNLCDRSGLSPGCRFRVLSERVNMKDLLAARDGTDVGYLKALDEQLSAVQALPSAERRSALTRAYVDQYRFHEFHLSRDKWQSAAFDEHYRRAVDCTNLAMDVAPPDARILPPLLSRRGLLVALGGDLDAGIDDLRAGLAGIRRESITDRAQAQLSLVSVLHQRVKVIADDDERHTDALHDLREAERLCREIAESGTPLAAGAHAMLAAILQLRRRLS
jgi:hypothetical protein